MLGSDICSLQMSSGFAEIQHSQNFVPGLNALCLETRSVRKPPSIHAWVIRAAVWSGSGLASIKTFTSGALISAVGLLFWQVMHSWQCCSTSCNMLTQYPECLRRSNVFSTPWWLAIELS